MSDPLRRWAGRWRRERGLGSYGRGDLTHDVSAGLMLTALLVPAGMGYATASGLPAQAGLYASVAALVAYALVGPSRVLVLGPDSSLTPLVAAAVLPLAAAGAAGDDRRLALAGLLALLVGVILVAGGLARLGFVSELLSKPIRLGYLNGIALVVIVGQLPALFGFSVDGHGLAPSVAAFVSGVRSGEVVPAAAAIGIGALGVVLAMRRAVPHAPGLLVAMAAATAIVWAFGLGDVPLVGALPGGLPAPAWDVLGWADVGPLIGPALGIAVVAFADTGVLSRSVAASAGREVDASSEMRALGIANLACGVGGGFPVSASASRTPVARASGARTQVAGLVAAAAVVVIVVAAPGLTRYLPSSALAAIVIAAVVSIVDLPDTVRLLRLDPTEFGLSVLAFAGVAVLGVLRGIAAAVTLSLVVFVVKAWRPHVAELVRLDGRKGYHDRARHPGGRQVPGLVILRFDAPLFFANAEIFADAVRRAIAGSGHPVRWCAIAAEPITDVDTTAAEMLERLDDELAADGIRLVFAELKGPVKDRLRRYGLGTRFAGRLGFPTLGTLVSTYVSTNDVDWSDWTDGPTRSAPPPTPVR